MDRLRTPFFFISLIALGLVVLVETGSSFLLGLQPALGTAASLGADATSALSGGEDHGLLATFPAGVPLPVGFRAIGEVRARDADRVIVDGRPFDGRSGWDPYRDWDAGRG